MRWLIRILGVALALWTVVLNLYHAGVFPPPGINESETAEAYWFDRHEHHIHNLVLIGPPYARGRLAGEKTGHLLRLQEQSLIDKLETWIPNRLLLQAGILTAVAWFQGINHYIPLARAREMYGTSLSSSHEFDYLADGFTRQVAYHGLHEVGQMMVDRGAVDMGCTVVAIPFQNKYVLGRNFDFEGGRIFDREKIIKWVFPEQGIPFVSVVFSGMVGTVTGINAEGLYISLNAAGSDSFRRIGIPSSLVVLDVLEHATTADEARLIIERAEMFITDIFVVQDRSGKLLRIEKSPDRTETLTLNGPSIVTNHLVAAAFNQDKANISRQLELTTSARAERGTQLLNQLKPAATSKEAVLQALSVIRDKGVDQNGKALPLGHRKAIDALIATHSIVYDPIEGILYVSEGPALVGKFYGYDLKATFAAKKPVPKDELPADPRLTPDNFEQIKQSQLDIQKAHQWIRKNRCKEGLAQLTMINPNFGEGPEFHFALGDAQNCLGNKDVAKVEWQKALALDPAYREMRVEIEGRLGK